MTDSNSGLFEAELEDLEARWEKGYFPAVIEAFRLCAVTGHPMPLWLSESVYAALLFTLQEGGRDGNRRKGGYLPQAKRREVDEWRWRTAEQALLMRPLLPHWGFPATREGAFEYASQELQGTPAQGSAGAIEDSHGRFQKHLKNDHPS